MTSPPPKAALPDARLCPCPAWGGQSAHPPRSSCVCVTPCWELPVKAELSLPGVQEAEPPFWAGPWGHAGLSCPGQAGNSGKGEKKGMPRKVSNFFCSYYCFCKLPVKKIKFP